MMSEKLIQLDAQKVLEYYGIINDEMVKPCAEQGLSQQSEVDVAIMIHMLQIKKNYAPELFDALLSVANSINGRMVHIDTKKKEPG